MISLFQRGCILASLLLLGACAGQYNGFIKATDEDVRIVANGGYSERATAQIAIVQNPDFNGGKISPKALRKIQEYSISCQRQTAPQFAGPWQSAGSGAANYTLSGTTLGIVAPLAFEGAKAAEYLIYGGGAYTAPGALTGLSAGSYALASGVGDCTRQFWEDVRATDPDFKGTHVVTVLAGKPGHSVPPALNRDAVAAPPSLTR